MTVTSTNLMKSHGAKGDRDYSSKVGKYSENGTSNGHILYRNYAGYYLHFAPDGTWMVSITYNILISSLVKQLVTYHSIC